MCELCGQCSGPRRYRTACVSRNRVQNGLYDQYNMKFLLFIILDLNSTVQCHLLQMKVDNVPFLSYLAGVIVLSYRAKEICAATTRAQEYS